MPPADHPEVPTNRARTLQGLVVVGGQRSGTPGAMLFRQSMTAWLPILLILLIASAPALSHGLSRDGLPGAGIVFFTLVALVLLGVWSILGGESRRRQLADPPPSSVAGSQQQRWRVVC